MIFVADEKYLSIGDVSLRLKKPLKPELVPVKYSKLLTFICGQIVNDNFFAFTALTLLVGHQKSIWPVKIE